MTQFQKFGLLRKIFTPHRLPWKLFDQRLVAEDLNRNNTSPVDVEIRWKSTYLMSKLYVELRSVVEPTFADAETLNHLKIHEYSDIESFWDLLNPFFEATKEVSTSSYPSFGKVIIILDYLGDHLIEQQKIALQKGDHLLNDIIATMFLMRKY
ncbi:hypothetical protein GEMRC1_010387 [Eukaryota sp. GEM-RC1]